MAKVSKNIKKLRTDKKMTQDVLAEKINVTRQTISSWENGRTQPDIDMLELLSSALEVGIEEIIYGEKRNIGLEPPENDKRKQKLMSIVFATLGSLLTATGLIIILVSFWDRIPDYFLAALSFLPLILGGTIAAWAYTKKKNSIGWSEGSSVAWVAGLAASYALVCVMFNYDADFYFSVTALSMLTLPMAFIMKSAFPLTAYYGAVSSMIISAALDGSEVFALCAGIALFLVGLIYIFKFPENDYRRIYPVWLVIICTSVIFAVISAESASLALPALLCSLLGIFSGLYLADNGSNNYYPFRFISVPGIAVILVVFCISTRDCLIGDIPFFAVADPSLLSPGISPIVFSLCLISGILCGRKKLKKDYVKIVFTALTGIAGISSIILPMFSHFLTEYSVDIANIFITSVALATSIVIIIGGIRKTKMLTVNLGLLMLCIVIYLTFIAGNFDIVFSGITFVIMGGVLLFINYRLSKSFKLKEKEVERNA